MAAPNQPSYETWLDYHLRQRSQEHLSRKIYHVAVGTMIGLLFIYAFTRAQSIAVIAFFTVLLVLGDLARLRLPKFNAFVLRVMGPLMRRNEARGLTAQSYFLLGCFFAIGCLPRPLAIQAIFSAAWMDPVAAIVGVRFGRRTWRSVFAFFFSRSRKVSYILGAKTVEGSFAGFIAAFLAGVIAWTGPWAAFPIGEGVWWPDAWTVFVLSCAGGVAATVAESWPSQWDDNINIPFWTGIVLWITTALMNIPMRFA